MHTPFLRLFTALCIPTLLLACGDGDSGRPIGATCTSNSQCESGICGGGVCLDPSLDEDSDGLLNGVEGALGTDALSRDSDADGVDDAVEVGDISTPSDGDGDGKIDAIESATADSDGDCIVDQSDPRDGFSDPASDQFPDACGTVSAGCTDNPLAGGCAASLGAMIYDCFMPAGSCRIASDGQQGSINWDNGARIELDSDTREAVYFGPSGQRCGTASQVEEGVTTITDASGNRFTVVERGDPATMEITCPGGEMVIQLTAELEASFERCSGSTESCITDTPGVVFCSSDSECDGGECCLIPGAQGVCLPPDQCPVP